MAWNAFLYSHLNLGVSDVLGIHISNSVMRPLYKIPWEEWRVIQQFFLWALKCPLAPNSMMKLESIPSPIVGLVWTQESLPGPFRVSVSAGCLVHIVSIKGRGNQEADLAANYQGSCHFLGKKNSLIARLCQMMFISYGCSSAHTQM